MMIIKRLLGDIMTSLGFVTAEQVEAAFNKQRYMLKENSLPEKLERAHLISESRKKPSKFPPLGQVLIDMGFATKEQLDVALNTQRNMLDIYQNIGRERLEAAIEMGSIVNSTLNLAELLAIIMEHVNQLTKSEASTLMLCDNKTEELVFSVPTGPKAESLTDIRIPPGKGIAGWVAKNEKPLIIPDVEKDPRFYPEIDKISGLKTKSILCIPLKAKSTLIGVLEAINKKDEISFTEEDALLLGIFASQAAIAIENARLYEELKHRLNEERKLQKRIIESEKFKALGQMSSSVAHDFNNILSAIIGYAEIALYDIPEPQESRQSIEQILKASQRAKELVNQILAFSRQIVKEPKPIIISSIVREVLDLLKASTSETIDFRQDISVEKGVVLADPTQIHQVLMNLCTNANQALVGKGGVIKVILSPADLSEKDDSLIDLNLENGPYIKVSVQDNGYGIDPAIKERIFEPYFTTKDKRVGTGMGLAVVRGIVESLGGAITVTSEPGKGSRFDVYLPRINKPVEIEGDSVKPLLKGSECILFVDNEEVLAEMGKEMLERLGYNVDCKTNPLEVLEIFRADPDKYDLIITDIALQNIEGDELAKKLMEIRKDIPIILSSGFSATLTEKEIKDIGIRDIAMKPYVMKDLAETIRKVLDGM